MLPRKAPKITSTPTSALVEGSDDISNLPEGVLQHILSFLPAQDVVRTCVLAKRWRHLWKSTTGLRFVCGGKKEPEFTKEIEFVDQLLRLRIREGTPLDTCEFRVEDEDEKFDMSHIVHWIRIALQGKVQVLQFISAASWGYIPSLNSRPLFISQYLKKLKLGGLSEWPDRLLDFSCCPNLEDLKIVNCIFSGLELISSQSLKRLTIKSGFFQYESRLPICAPNLVSLWLEVYDGRTPSLQRMPSLQTAVVKIHSDDVDPLDSEDNNQSILLQGLSEVQNLVLVSSYTDMSIFRRDLAFCFGFNNLRSLLLDEYWCKPADFSALACLLKLSPLLEKLTLQLYSTGPKHKVEIKLSCKPLEMSAAISKHLKTLEVKCEVYDDRVHNVLAFLSKQLNIWFQFSL